MGKDRQADNEFLLRTFSKHIKYSDGNTMHIGITEFYSLLQNQGIVVRTRINAGVFRSEGSAVRSMLSCLLTMSCLSTWLTGLLAYL